jgi:hypothetical protein
MASMLYAILVCSDRECDAVYEGWGKPEELEAIACELCGCTLEAVGFSEGADPPNGRPDSVEIQLRDVA